METRVTREQVEQFLYHEADLMDENAYEDWLALWDEEEALYWVPSNDDDLDPSRKISIIYDDRARLGERVARLETGAAWAQDPPSRLSRLIGNIRIEEESDGEVVVHSRFNLTEMRRDEQNTYAGRVVHRLSTDGGALKIRGKKVMLVDNDSFIGNLTFLI